MIVENRFRRIFAGIKTRCNNPNHSNFVKYGERGIKCLWDSFDKFKYDMYESYQLHIEKFGEKNTSIDRIDNNKDYSKENCRWATWREQANNKRNNKSYEFNGEKNSLADWSKISNINIGTLTHRIYTKYWSIEKALTTPVKVRKRNL